MGTDSRVTIHWVPDVGPGEPLPELTGCGFSLWGPGRILKPNVLFSRYSELVTCETCKGKLNAVS